MSGLACGGKKQQQATPKPADDAAVSHGKPRLVVLIVVDQLPSWSFGSQQQHLKAGIRTLLDTGTYYPRAQYPYATTYTAPGHAALGTGAPPAVTGILANEWYRRERGRDESAIADKEHPILLVKGAKDVPRERRKRNIGASPRQLRVSGIADWLREQTGGKGKSVAVSIKDRAANFVLGQRPGIAVWYDPGQEAMTSSTWYAKTAPPWLVDLARTKPVSANFGYVWQPRSVELAKRATGNVDNAPGEGGIYGLGNVFPHDLAKADSAKALRATPISALLTTQTAIAALHGEHLGNDDTPDVLAVSYSSHDYAGHTWGHESWERFELLLHIDEQVGILLAELDRVVGANKYAVVLTSDHGVTRMVEQSRQKKRAAYRVSAHELLTAAKTAAQRVLGVGDWIAAESASTIYLSAAFHKLAASRRQAAMAVIIKGVVAVDGVAHAMPTAGLHGNCDKRPGLQALICRSLDPVLSGDIFVATAPDSVLAGEYKSGTTHGSANPDDRFVPLIIRVPGTKGAVDHRQVSMLRVAPTLARLLGIKPGAAAKAPSLLD